MPSPGPPRQLLSSQVTLFTLSSASHLHTLIPEVTLLPAHALSKAWLSSVCAHVSMRSSPGDSGPGFAPWTDPCPALAPLPAQTHARRWLHSLDIPAPVAGLGWVCLCVRHSSGESVVAVAEVLGAGPVGKRRAGLDTYMFY